MKECIKCKDLLPYDAFGYKASSKDGYNNQCKGCRSLYTQENKERLAEYAKTWYINNKEHCATVSKLWAKDNQAYKDYRAQWKKDNKDKVNRSTNLRRARRLEQTPSLTADESLRIDILYYVANRVSRYTGIRMHVDHIIPLALGGLHHPLNLQVITEKENLEKGIKLPEVLSAELLALHKEEI